MRWSPAGREASAPRSACTWPAGATVLVNYSSSESAARAVADQIKEEGGEAFILKANVSDSRQVEALFKQIDKSHGGRVDILVNNAGVYIPRSLAESTEDDFTRRSTST